MIERPRLKTFLTLFPISDGTWGVRGGPQELWTLKLAGDGRMQAFCTLLPYLDGRHTREEIRQQILESGVGVSGPLEILDLLQTSSLLEDADPHGLTREELERHSDQLEFFSRFTSEGGAKYQALLKKSRIAVAAFGELGWCLARQLAQSGVGEVELIWCAPEALAPGREIGSDGDDLASINITIAPLASPLPSEEAGIPKLLIFAEEAHNPGGLEAVDAFAKRHNMPWLLVRSTDVHEAIVGPLFIPGETASYVSLEARLRSNMDHYAEYAAFDRQVRSSENGSRRPGGLRSAFEMLASIASIEAVKFLTGIVPPALAGRFIALDIITWESDLHEVLKVPRLELPYEAQHQAFPWKEAVYAAQERRS